MIKIILIYIAIINIVTFFIYGIDKYKAKHDKWRIKESTLLWFSVFGGSIGAWAGVKVWHHKTLHNKFRYGIPLILLAQIALIIGCLWLFSSCTPSMQTYIPQAPDYQDTTMWITEDKDTTGTGADIFYVVSTWETDWMHNGVVCHYADVWNAEHRAHMGIEIQGVAAYMAPGNRFFAPFYRHTTIDGWMTRNEDTIQNRTRISMEDVRTAFDDFIARRDNSRPLIIAGFSQGGMAVVELLKHMSDETYSHLAAAYIMGYKLTPEDTLCPHIRPAKGETDTGVTVCYNTVKDVRFIQPVISASCACINPVNWHTDATPAMLHDTITVTVATKEHVLVVSGYSGAEYPPYKGFINVGDIHSCEPWLYSDCIRQNMHKRVQALRKRN